MICLGIEVKNTSVVPNSISRLHDWSPERENKKCVSYGEEILFLVYKRLLRSCIKICEIIKFICHIITYNYACNFLNSPVSMTQFPNSSTNYFFTTSESRFLPTRLVSGKKISIFSLRKQTFEPIVFLHRVWSLLCRLTRTRIRMVGPVNFTLLCFIIFHYLVHKYIPEGDLRRNFPLASETLRALCCMDLRLYLYADSLLWNWISSKWFCLHLTDQRVSRNSSCSSNTITVIPPRMCEWTKDNLDVEQSLSL